LSCRKIILLAGAFFEEAIYNEEQGPAQIVINRRRKEVGNYLKST
jgi:hypothetical protein